MSISNIEVPKGFLGRKVVGDGGTDMTSFYFTFDWHAKQSVNNEDLESSPGVEIAIIDFGLQHLILQVEPIIQEYKEKHGMIVDDGKDAEIELLRQEVAGLKRKVVDLRRQRPGHLPNYPG